MTAPPPPLNYDDIDVKIGGGDIPPSTPDMDIGYIDKEGFDALTPEQQRSKRWTYRSDKPRKPPRDKKPLPPKPRPGQLTKPLSEFYGAIGLMIVPFDEPCGTAIIANAENCARALENLARENEAARRVIMALIQTSALGGVIAAHIPLAMAVAAHHVPALRNNPDVVTPLHAMSTNGTVTDE